MCKGRSRQLLSDSATGCLPSFQPAGLAHAKWYKELAEHMRVETASLTDQAVHAVVLVLRHTTACNKVKECQADRQAWDDQFWPGRHADAIAQVGAQIANLQKLLVQKFMGL